MSKTISIALTGNPNAGKTTLFNQMTGARQHVGNYPGVTVEHKEGQCNYKDAKIHVVDLPGAYSLTAFSDEELIARNYLIDNKPDVVVDVIDSSNLERNMYLAVQLIELGTPLVLAFNMSDLAAARGYEFDIDKLSKLLNVPIVSITASKKQGVEDLLDVCLEEAKRGRATNPESIRYGKEIEHALTELGDELDKLHDLSPGRRRWVALKMLEGDADVMQHFSAPQLTAKLEESLERLGHKLDDDPPTAIASHRYGFISGACTQTVRATIERRHSISDQIDLVTTNRFVGIPIFLVLMYFVFWLTFTVGAPFMDLLDAGFGWLGDFVTSWWPDGSESALKSLIVDGIIGGVGGVVIFLPNILLLFLAISILEDTGYMARAAFIMDRIMSKMGLQGKSFIPMLIGFGCSVPAIMATRTLDNRRDRLVTMMVVPLMSCGARMPIYALIIPAFFPQAWQAPLLWIIYFVGILLAIIMAKLLRVTLLKGEASQLLIELPPYRVPTFKSVLIHMWDRGWLYLKKAGTIILGISIVLWALTSYPQKKVFDRDYESEAATLQTEFADNPEALEDGMSELVNAKAAEEMSYTIAGRIGHAMEPVIRPMGFDWRIGTALIGAFAAKEVFVAQMGIVHSVGEADEESEDLRSKLREHYTPLIGLAIMLFCLISAPCMATIAITKREANSWAWAGLQLGGLTVLAWVVTTIVYQAGLLLGLG